MSFSPLIERLIQALRCLPGVGPKSAQRMAFHLLERNRDKAVTLADIIHQAMTQIKHCQQCNTFCENAICQLCANPRRDAALLCVVESPADVLAIEHTSSFNGYYFVLMGHLSPLDGIGPNEIGLQKLTDQLDQRDIREIILATNPTVEGEATAHYIAQLVKPRNLKITRIAHGVPMGGELEFINANTIAHALTCREQLF